MYLGIDFGTSGCRAIVIDSNQQIITDARLSLSPASDIGNRKQQDATNWIDSLQQLINLLAQKTDLKAIKRIAIDGTSGTLIACDFEGKALHPASMYNDTGSALNINKIKQFAPKNHITLSATSALARAVDLLSKSPSSTLILNQADYLSNYLCNQWGFSDYHNCLKLGYDEENQQWPEWIDQIMDPRHLPDVKRPGEVIGKISPELAQQLGFSKNTEICAGTTDSNAAFLAAANASPASAVTSLGSTLVLKLLSKKPVSDFRSGVYSHRFGKFWLVSGASNAGGKVLGQYFTKDELNALSDKIDISRNTGLNYYPLLEKGERFPFNDPDKKGVLTPIPNDPVIHYQGLLEGLSKIEKIGYLRFGELGVTPPEIIQTTGGGANNLNWMKMRERMIGCPVVKAIHSEACYGSARLALRGLSDFC